MGEGRGNVLIVAEVLGSSNDKATIGIALQRKIMVSLNIDPTLLQEVIDLNDDQPIEAVIETALREYIQRRKQLQVIKLFGTIDYADYDYNQQRQQP